ncbi:MAG: hypothetical protein AABN34_18005 [Acidobacteriota bacterium]
MEDEVDPQTSREMGTEQPKPTSEVAPTGRRQALRDIRRELTDEELSSPGVQKLLLDDLERAESESEVLRSYVDRFHESDKRAAILEVQLRGSNAFEILFGTGIGLGGAIMGLAPLFWSDQPKGALALALGMLLAIGSIIGRVIRR